VPGRAEGGGRAAAAPPIHAARRPSRGTLDLLPVNLTQHSLILPRLLCAGT
jgi:hypothetical protein